MTYALTSRPGLPRIAASMSAVHPDPQQPALVAWLVELAGRCDAELQVFHTHAPDPTSLPPAARGLLGSGVFVPAHEELFAADVARFRRAVPSRVAELLAALQQATGSSEAELMGRYEVQVAFTLARALQAHAVDLVCSHFYAGTSVAMFVAAQLLELPWVYNVCPGAVARDPGLFRLMLARAALVVPASAEAAAALDAAFGADFARRCPELVELDGGAALVTAIRALLARPRPVQQPPRGVRPAYVGAPTRGTELPPGLRPFLVLGAERTGSTLLVDALASQAGMTCAGEVFNPRGVRERAYSWLPEVEEDMDIVHRLWCEGPHALLRELYRQAAGRHMAWCGIKLLYYHGVADPDALGALLALPGLHLVHQVRANRLQRWLSHRRAIASDRWFALRGEGRPAPNAPLVLDPTETLQDFLLQEAMESRYRAIFDGVPELTIEYDDLAGSAASVLDRLGGFFGFTPTAFVAKNEKTGSGGLRASIENLEQLRAAFDGTRWHGHFFDES